MLPDRPDRLPGQAPALLPGPDGPEGLNSMAQGVQHGGLPVVVRQALQGRRVQQHGGGNAARMGNGLLLAPAVNNGVAGGLAPCPRRAGNRQERDGVEADHLLQAVPGRVQLRPQLHALGHIQGASAPHRRESLTSGGAKSRRCRRRLLVPRIGAEAGKTDHLNAQPLLQRVKISAQPPFSKGASADQKQPLRPGLPEPAVQLPVIPGGTDSSLLHHSASGIMRMISPKGISSSSASRARWCRRMLSAVRRMAGTWPRISWLA